MAPTRKAQALTPESPVICYITALNHAAGRALALSHNAKYIEPEHDVQWQKRRRTDGSTSWKWPDLVLRFQPEMFCNLANGITFGSNDAFCDILLDSNTANAMGEKHFILHWNLVSPDPNVIFVINQSKTNGILIDGQDCFSTQPQIVDCKRGTIVVAGECTLLVHMPRRGRIEDQQYAQQLRDALQTARLGTVDESQRLVKRLDPTRAEAFSSSNYGKTDFLQGRYEILPGLDGRGAFGCVRKCIVGDGELCAVKIIQTTGPNAYVDPKVERQMLRSLRHPHIIPYYHFTSDDTEAQIFMEYAQFGDLRKYKESKNLSYLNGEIVMTIMVQVLQALHYLSKRKVLHRDLKPNNILVTSENPFTVKVADFGIAKRLQAECILSSRAGTQGYQAPEVLARRKDPTVSAEYDHPADIFSLGVTLWELLVGKNPFRNIESAKQLRKALKQLDFGQLNEYKPKHSALLTAFITGMLSDKPEDRPSAAECLARLEICPESWSSDSSSNTSGSIPTSIAFDRAIESEVRRYDMEQLVA